MWPLVALSVIMVGLMTWLFTEAKKGVRIFHIKSQANDLSL
jgi:hypothetical protein